MDFCFWVLLCAIFGGGPSTMLTTGQEMLFNYEKVFTFFVFAQKLQLTCNTVHLPRLILIRGAPVPGMHLRSMLDYMYKL